MGQDGFMKFEFNKIIHEPARLLLLTFLASSPEKERSFTELRDHLQMTAGNLSIQLKNLQEAGLITARKSFDDNKPLTTVAITELGTNTLLDYLDEMERLILAVKKEQGKK
ncbi:MAG: transcriptional regulator [Firmicutes bacterium]|nr:transcriptional regulator [Bacillota bacterium]